MDESEVLQHQEDPAQDVSVGPLTQNMPLEVRTTNEETETCHETTLRAKSPEESLSKIQISTDDDRSQFLRSSSHHPPSDVSTERKLSEPSQDNNLLDSTTLPVTPIKNTETEKILTQKIDSPAKVKIVTSTVFIPTQVSNVAKNHTPKEVPIVTSKRESPTKVPIVAPEKEVQTNVPAVTSKKEASTKVPVVPPKKEVSTKVPVLAPKKESPKKVPVVAPKKQSPKKASVVASKKDSSAKVEDKYKTKDDRWQKPPTQGCTLVIVFFQVKSRFKTHLETMKDLILSQYRHLKETV